MNWSDAYLGIPWVAGGRHDGGHAGLDCWGLLRRIYAEQLHLALPDFGATVPLDGAAIAATMESNMGAWRPVDRPAPFDGVLLRKGKFACHVGVMVDRRRFLHVDEDIESCVERIDSPLWRRRTAGFYRHISRA